MADRVYKWTDDPMLGGIKDCDPDVVNECLMSLKYENTTDAIQNMYTTGQVETQTRGFEQLKQMRRSTFDLSKFTVVGSPTITEDGIASGFSDSNCLEINNPINNGSKFIIISKFTAKPGTNYVVSGVGQSFIIGTYKKPNINLQLILSSNGTSWNIPVGYGTKNLIENQEYYVKLTFDGSKYVLSYSTDGITYIDDIIVNCSSYIYNVAKIRIGNWNSYGLFTGSIDLSQFSITVDGKEVFNGNKTGLDVIKSDNYEVVGSPAISDDGVASGFGESNYLSKSLAIDLSHKYSFIGRFETNNNITTQQFIFASVTNLGSTFGLQIFNDGYLYVYYSPISGDGFTKITPIQTNTLYDYIIDYDGVNTLIITLNGVQHTVTNSNYNVGNISFINIGIDKNATQPFLGSIDLNASKIYVDGNLVYQPCLKIPYTQSKTGSKIVDGVYRDRVIDLYEQQGQAGYYTIDEPNKNFTLPMGEIYGMIESKGTYQPPLLSTMWSDHLLNDMSWLRADTFSWQDGNTYLLAYNELLAEYNNSASTTKTEDSITFKRTPKGYKIALADQETAILNKYNSDGIAWYYILDTTNKKFKLPRTKFGFEGLRTSVGDDIEAGLPNISGSTGTASSQGGSVLYTSGAFTQNTSNKAKLWWYGDSDYGIAQVNFDASRSSSIYGNSSTVQPPATQMYLYFYVGAFTKSAESQTAGLKAELLNNKLDLNANNLDNDGKSLISGLGMPSSRYTDLTLGESGSVYTAPANGYVVLLKNANATNQQLQIKANNMYSAVTNGSYNTYNCKVWMPVKKGDIFEVTYTTGGTTNRFSFIYAEGSKED